MNLQGKYSSRILFTFIAVLGFTAAASAQCRIAASGVVIDEAKNGIGEAAVYFRGPLRYGDVIPVTPTARGGEFLHSDCIGRRFAWLMIVGPAPHGFSKPLNIVTKLEGLRGYRGIKLKVPDDPNFVYHLDYVRPTIVFKGVTIDLSRFLTDKGSTVVPEILYTLVYNDKNIVWNGKVDANAIDRKDGLLRWALPIGSWKVTFSMQDGSRRPTATYQLQAK